MNYYANKIQEIAKGVNEKASFDEWSMYELRERADVLKSMYGKHEQKCMAKKAGWKKQKEK